MNILDLLDAKLFFPEWFNINNIDTKKKTEKEEVFLDLRFEIASLLRQFLKNEHLYSAFMNKLDQKMLFLVNSNEFNIRLADQILLYIDQLIHFEREEDQIQAIFNKYERVLFAEEFSRTIFYPAAATLMDIYQCTSLKLLSPQQVYRALQILLSQNGILNLRVDIQHQSVNLFIREYKKSGNEKGVFTDCSNQIMDIVMNQVFTHLHAINERSEDFNYNVFQVVGSIMCSKLIEEDKRNQYCFNMLGTILHYFEEVGKLQVKRDAVYINVLKNLIKGLQSGITPLQTDLFMQLMEKLFNLIIKGCIYYQNAISIVNLMADRIMIFKNKLYDLYSKKLSEVISKCEVQVVSAYFAFFNNFRSSYETQIQIVLFI